jgi:hypothetical protein
MDFYHWRIACSHIHESFIKSQKLSRAALCQLFGKRDEKTVGRQRAFQTLPRQFSDQAEVVILAF